MLDLRDTLAVAAAITCIAIMFRGATKDLRRKPPIPSATPQGRIHLRNSVSVPRPDEAPGAIVAHGGKSRDDLPADGYFDVRNARIGIDYRGSARSETRRTIVPAGFSYRIARDNRVFILTIEAFCELRHDHRTFKYDRIREAFDPETGEIIPNLGEFLWARRE